MLNPAAAQPDKPFAPCRARRIHHFDAIAAPESAVAGQ
jgi:hypothetical protein